MNSPFKIQKRANELVIIQDHEIHFKENMLTSFWTFAKGGIDIAQNFFDSEKPLLGNESSIIQEIHKRRFDPSHAFVITGGHFDELYVRNLGIFFNALLDARVTLSLQDWEDRQKIVLKTVALDLEVFRLADNSYTTIVPLENNYFTALNIFTKPSDSLFAILYTLRALTDPEFLSQIFYLPPNKKVSKRGLQTKKAGEQLLKDYKSILQKLVQEYRSYVMDPKTQLIKKSIKLASARDGIKRSSSFYDNVICWATIKLASELGIITISKNALTEWKKGILKAFWDRKSRIFLDDLSYASIHNHHFSADWLIAISTQFLDVKNKSERNMIENVITFIEKRSLDQPLPLHYSNSTTRKNLYWPVRYAAPNYMGRSIWSHWGIEYIKMLILLSYQDELYRQKAENYLKIYKKQIEKYHGYPELYGIDGSLFSNRLYRGVLHNGWVINYEQAKMMFENSTK